MSQGKFGWLQKWVSGGRARNGHHRHWQASLPDSQMVLQIEILEFTYSLNRYFVGPDKMICWTHLFRLIDGQYFQCSLFTFPFSHCSKSIIIHNFPEQSPGDWVCEAGCEMMMMLRRWDCSPWCVSVSWDESGQYWFTMLWAAPAALPPASTVWAVFWAATPSSTPAHHHTEQERTQILIRITLEFSQFNRKNFTCYLQS